MKNAKKFLALFLTLALAASLLAGCTGGGNNSSTPSSSSSESSTASESSSSQSSSEASSSEPSSTPTDPVEVEPSVEYPAYNMGELTIALGSAEGGEVGHDVFAGTPGKDYTDPAVYTFNDVMTATTSMNWNPLAWETSDDSYVLDYISSPFYDWVLNSDQSGWSIVPEMAADYPVDVTSEYVGQFGVAEGETGKAWKVALNPNAVWEDGTPINADTYIYSYQQLLDPAQLNRRADSLYAGDFTIVGAQGYFYSGTTTYDDLQGSIPVADLVKGEDGQYTTAEGQKVFIGINVPLAWTSGNTFQSYVENYGDQYFDMTNWEAISALVDENGVVPLTDENMELFMPIITGNSAWGETEADFPNYLTVRTDNDVTPWEEVGILKTGDYELVFISTTPVESPAYYVPYYLPMYLVYEPLYEELKVFTDGKYSTTYGTTQETTMSYGPYKLTYFELDKQLTFERNESWYGYSDGKHTGQYQTDIVSTQVIDKHETQLLAFLNGEIDNVSLQQEDMEKYASSEYIRYTPQSYTTKLSWNTDETVLAERGTQILGNMNFRKAFALAIDRSTFAASYTAAGTAGYGLLNYMYVYDPFSGAAYRDHDAAKAALCDLYGVTYGEDGDYDDVDEAYDAITGYDIEQARETMEIAYQQCLADGLYKEGEKVTITMLVYQSDDIYVKMFNFLNDALKNACVGTGFEGNVELAMKVDADYYETMYSGAADMIFTTWGGAAYSPFTMLSNVYVDAADGSGNQMEYGFDATQVMVTMTLNGTEYTQDLKTWADWMGNKATIEGLEAFGAYDADSRCQIFAKLEYAYLANFVTTPMYYRNVGSMISQKGDYPLTQYMDMVGFGGIRFYTFNYDDQAWAGVASSLTY